MTTDGRGGGKSNEQAEAENKAERELHEAMAAYETYRELTSITSVTADALGASLDEPDRSMRYPIGLVLSFGTTG
jgi:DNA-binding protein H-NS